MTIAAASAAACSLAGSAVEAAGKAIAKPIEIAAKNPKATKTVLGAAAAAPFVAEYFGDEDDGFDEDEEEAQP